MVRVLALAAVLLLPLAARAELPPGSYDKLRKEAGEALTLQVTSVKVVTSGNTKGVMVEASIPTPATSGVPGSVGTPPFCLSWSRSMSSVAEVLGHLQGVTSEKVSEHNIHLGLIGEASYILVQMDAGDPNPPHHHPQTASSFLVVAGTGKIVNGDQTIEYKPGMSARAEPGVMHQIVPEAPSLFLTIQDPAMHFTADGWSDTVYD